MNDDLAALTQQPWHWEWVPPVRPGEPAHEEWTEYLVGLFEEWTSEGLAAVRATWPADAGAEFPITSDMVGRDTARWLLERAGGCPPGPGWPGARRSWAIGRGGRPSRWSWTSAGPWRGTPTT